MGLFKVDTIPMINVKINQYSCSFLLFCILAKNGFMESTMEEKSEVCWIKACVNFDAQGNAILRKLLFLTLVQKPHC